MSLSRRQFTAEFKRAALQLMQREGPSQTEVVRRLDIDPGTLRKWQRTLLTEQQDRLINMRLDEELDQELFAKKHQQIRDRVASIKLQLDALDRSKDETAELAVKVLWFSTPQENQQNISLAGMLQHEGRSE